MDCGVGNKKKHLDRCRADRKDRGMHTDGILLLGPTGAGKSPLGDCLQAHGLGGLSCRHFDFGENLRRAAALVVSPPEGLDADDMATICRVLRDGALLEDDQFYIAAAILRDFIQREVAGPSACIVMNGLPRHVGQAEAIDALVAIGSVVVLDCDAQTVRARISSNAGGDREGRGDDAPGDVERKLRLYEARTAPLIAYYRKKGVRILQCHVSVLTQAEDIRRRIESTRG